MKTQLTPQETFRNCQQSVPALRVEPLGRRRKRLSALRQWIHNNRSQIHEAVYADFSKPAVETDATEIFHVLNELRVALRELDRWAAPMKVDAPFYFPGTRAWTRPEPRGVCLIISPWNYPFGLSAGPLVSALAAGNSIILKPSEMTPNMSGLIKSMCDEIFDPGVVAVCEGGVEVSQALLSLPFDHIFFTGSPAVGKVVMKAASEHLSTITLELGGKSPVIITESARLDDAATRVAAGKFINNGQTCIAPDYILADEKIAPEFTSRLIEKTKALFAAKGDFESSADYARIVNEAHFARLTGLIDEAVALGAKAEWQGPRDKASRFIHPVVLTHVPTQARIMSEEIFGPVLPIITYRTIEEAISFIVARPKALAVYVFTQQKSLQKKVVAETSSGTVCINDCAIQFLHHGLPFGGVNHSGMGHAHGYFGFRAFSNDKPVLRQRNGFTAVRPFYPPFTRRTKQLMDWFLRLF